MRDLLRDLVAQAPDGLGPVACVALGLFERFELLECLRVLRACAEWAHPDPWHERAEAWAMQLEAELLAALREAVPSPARAKHRRP
jgi:hypothetical protein